MIDNSLVETIIAETKTCFSKNKEYFSKTRDIFTARLQSYILESKKYLEAAIILDFDEIKVLTPSWADEFITGIKLEFSNTLEYINTENPSVRATLKTVLES